MMKTVVVVAAAAAATATAVAAKVELVHAVVKSTTLVAVERHLKIEDGFLFG